MPLATYLGTQLHNKHYRLPKGPSPAIQHHRLIRAGTLTVTFTALWGRHLSIWCGCRVLSPPSHTPRGTRARPGGLAQTLCRPDGHTLHHGYLAPGNILPHATEATVSQCLIQRRAHPGLAYQLAHGFWKPSGSQCLFLVKLVDLQIDLLACHMISRFVKVSNNLL